MEARSERFDLRHQRIDQPLRGRVGNARNVVDRLLGIKLGTLAADLVEDVDQMRLDVQEPEFEDGEDTSRACPDDKRVRLDRFVHSLLHARLPDNLVPDPGHAWRSGVRTIKPSISAVTLIWQDSREFDRMS